MKQTLSQSNPLSPADEIYLAEVAIECRVRLESALDTAERYRSQVPALATTLADAVTECQQVISILDDLEVYADGGQS
jgi:hypothetical protein